METTYVMRECGPRSELEPLAPIGAAVAGSAGANAVALCPSHNTVMILYRIYSGTEQCFQE